MNRIIPARAGFTHCHEECRGGPQDHPRSRGVYGLRDDLRAAAAGSSPLARGLRGPGLPHRGGVRIIPARAGFTRELPYGVPVRLDHPRSRGVYQRRIHRLTRPRGSSPLARGLLLVGDALAGMSGIIPARAGFTPDSSSRSKTKRDHPRSRGVYRAIRARRISLGRIIPARAGFTGIQGTWPQ